MAYAHTYLCTRFVRLENWKLHTRHVVRPSSTADYRWPRGVKNLLGIDMHRRSATNNRLTLWIENSKNDLATKRDVFIRGNVRKADDWP